MLKDHYGLELDDVLEQFVHPVQLEAFRLRRPSDEGELENLKRLARLHPVGAFLSAVRYLEQVINEFLRDLGGGEMLRRRPPWAILSHRFLSQYGVEWPPELEKELEELRGIRNLVAHGREEPSEPQVVNAVDVIERVERHLEGVDRERVRGLLEAERQELLQRRRNVVYADSPRRIVTVDEASENQP
jgi:hypothetical protein